MESWWKSCLGCCCCVTLPIHIISCMFGMAFQMMVKMFSKFALILHVFTGLPFFASGRKMVKIMSRHFKGGFITELTSQSVLNLGCYVFSIGISLLAWFWFDKTFGTTTLTSGLNAMLILWLIIGLFNLWYPVLGIYVIIIVNRFLVQFEKTKLESRNNSNAHTDDDNDLSFLSSTQSTQHLWVAPLAAIFVGCVAMLCFTYIAGIFMDTVDVLFICYAIDKDNNVDLAESEMGILLKAMPEGIVIAVADPVSQPDIVKEHILIMSDGQENTAHVQV
mmetsp:Transcript_3733/g.4809  ORF Transcript_3733/g.4809 Transcript_3733/m.4809 type:complete len:277 (+) Transcript_3733:2-832(+)